MEKVICSVCKIEKLRELAPIEKNLYRRVDANGRVWAGRRCPQCAYAKHKRYSTKKDPVIKVAKAPLRKCRACNTNLSAAYYFYHPSCRPASWSSCEDLDPHLVAA